MFAGKTQLVLCDWSNNSLAIDVKMDGSVLEAKSSFEMLGLSFSSKLHWGIYIVCVAKATFKKIGALICSKKYLSLAVAHYFCKSAIQPCMEYCCHVCGDVPNCYMGMLDKLQKRVYRTPGPSLAAVLEL